MAEDFDGWLSGRLQELKTDEAVFGPYITSILEGEEDLEEKIEGLDDLLMALGGSIDVEALRNEILKRWNEANKMKNGDGTNEGLGSNDLSTRPSTTSDCSSVDQQLFDRLLTITSDTISSSSDQASSSAAVNRPDAALRAAILSNYRTGDSESDDEEDEAKCTRKKSNDDDICKNDNSERVLNDHRELKEKAKQDSAKKREKDREDRAKQKQAALDRKDKAKKKATKVERKR